MRREEHAKKYIPMPPGVTTWRKVRVYPNTEAEILMPLTRPLAACETDLDDDEVLGLLAQLKRIAKNRGLKIED